jgi:general secretion pathway protein B
VNTFGVERRFVRTAALGARIGLRGPLVALAAGAVFACSYAISGSSHPVAAKAQAPPDLPVSSVTALVPASLRATAPIPVVEVPRPKPAPRPSTRAAGTPAARAPAPETSAPPPSNSAPPASAHESAPAPSAPARAPTPSKPSSGGEGGSTHSSGGASGGTFESSG